MFNMDEFCLVCNASINLATSVNINNTSVKYNKDKLVSIVINILGPETPVTSESSICRKCYSLFKLYEQAQWTAKNTESEILRTYYSNSKHTTNEKNKKKDNEMQIIDIQSIKDEYDSSNILSFDKKVKTEKYSLKNYFESAGKDLTESVENQNVKNEDKSTIVQENIVFLSDDHSILTEDQVVDLVKNEQIEVEIPIIEQTPENSIILDVTEFEPTKSDEKCSKFSCPSCKKECKTNLELRNHVKTHSELRPYMCEICGHSYRHKQALEIHIGMHNGINPFKCSHCDKCFTQKGTLMRHMLIHTGETPYQCEICGKRFVHHTSYNMHILSHTREKAYKCNVCDLSLLSTSHLKRHMRVHTGEKPYSCSTCLKRFAQRYNLLTHQKTHNRKDGVRRRRKNVA